MPLIFEAHTWKSEMDLMVPIKSKVPFGCTIVVRVIQQDVKNSFKWARLTAAIVGLEGMSEGLL